MKERIYLDHAASTKPYTDILKKWQTKEEILWANPSSIHAEGRNTRALLDEARIQVSEILECTPKNIVFTSGGTEALHIAIIGTYLENIKKDAQKTTILASPIAHKSIQNALEYLKKEHKASIEYIPITKEGRITQNAFQEKNLSAWKNISLIVLEHANSETGALHEVKEIGLWLQEKRNTGETSPTFIVDCACSIVTEDIRPNTLLADSLIVSGEKFGGVSGCGILYHTQQIQPLMQGSQEWGIRGGTENIRGIYCTAQAFKKHHQEKESKKIQYNVWKKRIHEYLESENRVIVTPKNSVPHILTFLSPGSLTGQEYVIQADINGIALSSGTACSSGSIQASQTLQYGGFSEEESLKGVRISFGHSTTENEIQTILQKFKTFGR